RWPPARACPCGRCCARRRSTSSSSSRRSAEETMATQPIDVLVIGAGPVGLTTAIELTRRGGACRVVDRRPTPRPGSRACTVWQRTLETFDLMGVPVGDYVASGSRYVHRTYHLAGFPAITHDMTEPGSAHPNAIIIAQTDTERMLTEHLA